MGITRLVLKIIALSLTAVAVVCAIIAYWDRLVEITNFGRMRDRMCVSEYDDFEE